MNPDFNTRVNYSSYNNTDMEKYYIACAKECLRKDDNKGYKKYMELAKCLRENMK